MKEKLEEIKKSLENVKGSKLNEKQLCLVRGGIVVRGNPDES